MTKVSEASKLSAQADALELKAKGLRERAAELRKADLRSQPFAERLIYAAYSRCPCGFGMAYDPASEGDGVFRGPSKWECSGILLGTGDKSVAHQHVLPFAFYEIKSERQPSANGATTRIPTAPAEAPK